MVTSKRDAHMFTGMGTEVVQRNLFDVGERVEAGCDASEIADAEIEKNMALAEELKRHPIPFPPGPFDIVYADPPWYYEPWSSIRSAWRRYPLMSTEDICALDVASLCKPDAVCFLWVTVPYLPQGLEVLKAWGFEYKSQIVWDKLYKGLGKWVRINHELLLIGRRGNFPTPAGVPDSVVCLKRLSKHSEKPKEFGELICTMYPNTDRLEMFARQEHEGFVVWGNEVD